MLDVDDRRLESDDEDREIATAGGVTSRVLGGAYGDASRVFGGVRLTKVWKEAICGMAMVEVDSGSAWGMLHPCASA